MSELIHTTEAKPDTGTDVCAVRRCNNPKEKLDDLTCRAHDLLIPRNLRRALAKAEVCTRAQRRNHLIIRAAGKILTYLALRPVPQAGRIIMPNGPTDLSAERAKKAMDALSDTNNKRLIIEPGGR